MADNVDLNEDVDGPSGHFRGTSDLIELKNVSRFFF